MSEASDVSNPRIAQHFSLHLASFKGETHESISFRSATLIARVARQLLRQDRNVDADANFMNKVRCQLCFPKHEHSSSSHVR
jgi:hypothetical protein